MKPLYLLIAVMTVCGCKAQAQRKDTLKVVMLLSDTSDRLHVPVAYWQYGYSVRELHNTRENDPDAGGRACIGSNGQIVDCYEDYWKHLYYIDEKKRPINKNIIVWMAKNP